MDNIDVIIADLQSRLAILSAKDQIRDILSRYCRAVDRLDKDLLLSCYHADGYDDHMPFVKGTPEEFVAFTMESSSAALTTSFYMMGQELIRVNGDEAHVESYCISAKTLRETAQDGSRQLRISGMRSIDRFECREGEWRIYSRKFVPEWGLFHPIPAEEIGPFKIPAADAAPLSRRDKGDPSYTI